MIFIDCFLSQMVLFVIVFSWCLIRGVLWVVICQHHWWMNFGLLGKWSCIRFSRSFLIDCCLRNKAFIVFLLKKLDQMAGFILDVNVGLFRICVHLILLRILFHLCLALILFWPYEGWFAYYRVWDCRHFGHSFRIWSKIIIFISFILFLKVYWIIFPRTNCV